MKKVFCVMMTLGICLGSFGHAIEISDYYSELLAGANFLQTKENGKIEPDFHPGYIVSGVFGYHLSYGFRIEGEYAFRRNSLINLHYFGQDFLIDGHYQSSSYMANVFWDFSLWKCIFRCSKPYIGGGVGYDVQQFHASEDSFRFNEDKKGFAWQIMLGLRYSLSSFSEISVEYKFHKGPLNHIYSHVVGIGFTYNFGNVCECYEDGL